MSFEYNLKRVLGVFHFNAIINCRYGNCNLRKQIQLNFLVSKFLLKEKKIELHLMLCKKQFQVVEKEMLMCPLIR